jgi:putative chitobiose transport system substrate-binding protein
VEPGLDHGLIGPNVGVFAVVALASESAVMTVQLTRRSLLLSAAAAGLAAACGRRSLAPELNLWTLQLAPKFNRYFADLMASWTTLHPDDPLRWTDLPWGSVERKLLAAVYARTAPDVVNLNPPFAANLASKGGLTDLTPLLPSDAAERYLPSVWQACRDPDAGQIAVPWYLTVRLSLVNRELLDQADIAAPPTRWDEIPAFARQIRKRTGRYGLFLTTVPDDSAEMLETLVQMGVSLLNSERRAAFNSPAGRRAFRFWTELYQEGLLPREVVSQGQRRAIELFQSGDLAMAATGAEFLRSIQTNAPGVAAVTESHPPVTGADGTANVALMTLAVPRQSTKQALALQLALLLTNATNQARFATEARVLPSSVEALAMVRSQLQQEQLRTPQQDQIRKARLLSAITLESARVLVPALPGIKRLQKILYTQLQRAMLGQVESAEALGAAAMEWDRYAASRWPLSQRNS